MLPHLQEEPIMDVSYLQQSTFCLLGSTTQMAIDEDQWRVIDLEPDASGALVTQCTP